MGLRGLIECKQRENECRVHCFDMIQNSTKDIVRKVKNIFAFALQIEPSTIAPETRLKDIDNLDTNALISVALSIEGTFKLRLTPSELGAMETIAEIVSEISSRLKP